MNTRRQYPLGSGDVAVMNRGLAGMYGLDRHKEEAQMAHDPVPTADPLDALLAAADPIDRSRLRADGVERALDQIGAAIAGGPRKARPFPGPS